MLDSTVTTVVKFFTRFSGVITGFTVDIFSASICCEFYSLTSMNRIYEFKNLT